VPAEKFAPDEDDNLMLYLFTYSFNSPTVSFKVNIRREGFRNTNKRRQNRATFNIEAAIIIPLVQSLQPLFSEKKCMNIHLAYN
jgi:hypothetical protein